MTTSIITPTEGLRYVQVKAPDGHRFLVPIDEERWQGVQHAERVALLAHAARAVPQDQ